MYIMPYRQIHDLGDERNGDLEDDLAVESRRVTLLVAAALPD
jgi:hypothetical protein